MISGMKCDLCDNPAVVHEVTVKNGVKREVHLCEQHAREAGIPIPGTQPINQLLSQFVKSQQPAKKKSPSTGSKIRTARKASCPACSMTFSQFRQSGVLGCPECYEAFDRQLTPLIERSQCSASNHVGKTPKRAGISLDRQRLIQQLTKELDIAVNAEQYERAAQLRDRLQQMTTRGAQADATPLSEAGDST